MTDQDLRKKLKRARIALVILLITGFCWGNYINVYNLGTNTLLQLAFYFDQPGKEMLNFPVTRMQTLYVNEIEDSNSLRDLDEFLIFIPLEHDRKALKTQAKQLAKKYHSLPEDIIPSSVHPPKEKVNAEIYIPFAHDKKNPRQDSYYFHLVFYEDWSTIYLGIADFSR